MGITLKNILQGIEVVAARGLETPITGIHYDSRQVKPGFIFVAIKGFRTDGHFYLDEAAARGAAGLIIEREVPLPPGVAWAHVKNTRRALALLAANFYGHPSRKLALVGVTGTNGKTTTTYLIEAVLRTKGAPTGLIGTVWNKIGEKKIPVLHTTPESLDLQSLLREMVAAGIETVAMEVSSHGLVLERVTGCEFDVGVFTNFTQDHLDFHQDLRDYLAAKMLLFTGLERKRTKNRPCYAVINVDDSAGKAIAEKVKIPVVTYGIRENADVEAKNINLSARGTAFTVTYQGREIPFSLSLPGEFNVYNSLAAICVGLQEGVELSTLQEALQKVKGVPGRFEVIEEGQNFTVVVDYAHTPDGLANILHTSRGLAQGRIVTVFGCGGDRDPGKRPLMGRISGEFSDFTIITSDNPRTEDPGQILAQIEAGIKQIANARYIVIEDRYEAIRTALRSAQEGDFVIIAGKGHEGYQIIGDQGVPFDDRLVAREIIVKEILN